MKTACQGPVAPCVDGLSSPNLSYTPSDMTAVLVLLLGKEAETVSACLPESEQE